MAASAAGRCLRLGLRAAGSLITQQGPLGCREALSDTWVSAAAFSRRPSAGAAGWRRYTSAAQAETWDTFRQTFCSIQVEVGEDGVAVLTLDRPEALNALNAKLMHEVVSACMYLDRNHPAARVIIITGAGDKAFAAGADIKEMATVGYAEAYNSSLLNGWETLRSVRKPLIAAVNGYALGGGCELALMCDIILASDTAQFGQPEITLGVIPGMGGTQRLARAVGKSVAMELVLTGRRVSADEAARIGLISRAVPAEELMPEARRVAAQIARHSAPAVAKAKECIAVAQEAALGEGLRFEKREFWSCFALEDQKEGMAAFVQKRRPEFTHK